ncbi:DNA cytosine methyltransferase [Carnobacterium divergens]|uniref:DNA cytosine methyltransferase n=1 Tax=Carnobacterium divergens TaxID=2748 RepID=UPI002892507F|nr:DNA cytosine methyltransferase [Carnobacterium divergens]MDT2012602.1 DNA cytosine methyltransferase [Carnobacterium divergens]
MITTKSYFSEAGGMDLGLLNLGIELVESFKIDKKACETMKLNFDHKINECDITKIKVLDQVEADVYVGTFPCTRYSSVADISGTRTGDDLFLHFFRHVALAQPEMYIVENVPGMRKFQVVMECLTKLPNYYVRVECPVNANWWLPQERKRLIVIGSKKPFENLEYPMFETKMVVGDILEDDPFVHIPDYVQSRIDGKYRDKPIITKRDGIAPTCIAHYSKDKSTRLVDDGSRVRPYTRLEYQRLQSFPDTFQFAGTENDAIKQIGNAVPPVMGEWIGHQIKRYFAN